jgi:hypothetical protein
MNASDNDEWDSPEIFDRRRKKPETAAAATIVAKSVTNGAGTETGPTITEADRYIDDVVERMKAHLASIDGAQATMISETKKAALLLMEARKKYPDRERDICKRVGIKFEGTRHYELLAIGGGRKSIAQIRDADAKRKRVARDRKKAALPWPAPKLPPTPPAPSAPPKATPKAEPVRDVPDQPKMLSAQQAMSLIYPILEKVETQALMAVATQVSTYSARRRNTAKARVS